MDIVRSDRAAQEIVGLHESVRLDELGPFFERAMAAAGRALGERGLEPAGPPVALYEHMQGDTVEVTAGFPVPPGAAPSDVVVAAMLPGGPTAEAVHQGPYEDLRSTHRELTTWFGEQGLTPPDVVWEEYLVGPESEADPAQWQTRVVYPVG